MTKIRVGVIRGGVGSEYDISLKTGSSVLKNIPQDKYSVADILITKDKQWHIGGFPTTLSKLANQVDVVFNALHGEYGEDGAVQRELEQFGIPYTGSGTFSSAVAMNKAIAKYYFKQYGMMTPQSSVVKSGDDIEEATLRIFRKMPGPYVVKPASSGSSVGVSLVDDFESLLNALKKTLEYNTMMIIEEYISGREITCGAIDGMASGEPYATLPVEIITPEESKFFNYEAKYSGDTLEVCPANLLSITTKKIQEHAVKAHKSLGMRHYSRSDFILSKRGLYILETNSLPGLTEESLLPKALKTAGLELPEFLDYVLALALEGK
jgi:D-alanine-D-alanine ligase